ncbi:MAG: hypothetical protein QXY45_02240 [Candidatus Aenigmatarchaeota archaeon]
MNNVNFPIGSIVLIDKIDNDFGFFDFIFGKICEKAKEFKEISKLLIYNKMTYGVSTVGQNYFVNDSSSDPVNSTVLTW